MKKSKLIYLFLFIMLSIVFGSLKAQENKQIYFFTIEDEIAKPAWLKVNKAMKESTEKNSDIILLRLNTYGGLLDMADSIRTALLNSKIPVWVFIDNNAASAGALISIACDKIYMRSGANIGAATVVNQTGEAVPDKYQSYMRSMMRSTAEATGRNPDIAEAMVDPRKYVQHVSDSGQVLTMTASEAIKNGFCDGMAENINDILKQNNIENSTVYKQTLTSSEKFIAFLTKPFVAGILIMMIIGGIYLEFQAPGTILPIAIAALGAILYFAPHYIEGLAANWEIVIFVIGLILLAIEIFALPGFGVFGFAGIILMFTALVLAMVDNVYFKFDFTSGVNTIINALFTVIIASFAATIGSYFIAKKLFSGRSIFGQLSLSAVQLKEEGFISSDNSLQKIIGCEGVAHTDLRPAGKIKIGNEIYDATANVGYIEKNQKIKVVNYMQSQLVVIKIKETSDDK